MRTIGSLLALLFCCFETGFAALEPVALLPTEDFSDWYYQNPSSISDIGDPLILFADGAYWCFATSSPLGYRVWRSEDLINWTEQKKSAFLGNRDSWGRSKFWAPEVYFRNDLYYMFYSAAGEGNLGMRIGIASSSVPEGPYVDLKTEPLFDLGYSVIDASFFVDDDGQPYLYYSRDCSENIVDGVHESHTYGVKLKKDLSGIDGEPVLLIRPDQAWEQFSGPDWLWNEGGIVQKHGDKYWMFYSSNFYAGKEYGVGVASADGPLGPFVKADWNPLLQFVEEDGDVLVSGPGHNSFLTTPGGEQFMVYHTHRFPDVPSGNRQMALDRFVFRADGTPCVNGPTLYPQLRPLEQLGVKNLLPEASVDVAAAKCLADGDYGICNGPDGERSFTGQAIFKWEKPVSLRALVIYPEQNTTGTVTITLNGQQTISVNLADVDALPGASFRLHFAAMDVKDLEIDAQGGVCEVIALGT